MKKKVVLVLGSALIAGALFARPHHGGFGGPRGGFGGHRGPMPVMHAGPRMPMHRPMPPPVRYHHRNFWPSFVGGVVGGVVADALIGPTIVTAPAVVTTPVVAPTVYAQPTYVTQQVWVPGRYVDQVQPNGTVVRVWQPGHYESRSVLVQ